MYSLFLDGVQFPVTPEKVTMSISNMNDTITLMNDGEVNLLKRAGLTELSFDVLLPNVRYPFAVYPNGYQPASYYLDKLESLKISQKPFIFILSRSKPNGTLLFDTNLRVSLEEYEIEEDAENGFDLMVSISLKQFRDYGNKKLTIKSSSTDTTKVTKTNARTSDKVTAKSYTVKAGDTLWTIAKREFGNGAKYTEIAKINNLSNPNLIRIGQVLKLG